MSSVPFSPSHEPEYAWEVATLYPAQGEWTESEYLNLTDHAERRIELADGRLEFLPMPTWIQEELLRFFSLRSTSLSKPARLARFISTAYV